MSNFYEFAGTHPFITLFSIMILAHMPVAIINALKNQDPE